MNMITVIIKMIETNIFYIDQNIAIVVLIAQNVI